MAPTIGEGAEMANCEVITARELGRAIPTIVISAGIHIRAARKVPKGLIRVCPERTKKITAGVIESLNPAHFLPWIMAGCAGTTRFSGEERIGIGRPHHHRHCDHERDKR
jgi:hypothetical protein